MVIPIHNPDGDPFLRRGQLAIRLGAVIPVISLGVLMIGGGFINAAAGSEVATGAFLNGWVLVFSLVGQIFVWTGMYSIRRSQAWGSGVVGYLWLGGVFNCLALCAATLYMVSMAAFLAPLVGVMAKRNQERRHEHSGSGAGNDG